MIYSSLTVTYSKFQKFESEAATERKPTKSTKPNRMFDFCNFTVKYSNQKLMRSAICRKEKSTPNCHKSHKHTANSSHPLYYLTLFTENLDYQMKNKMDLQLVFIPIPLIGHLSSAVNLANLLIDRDPRLSITILLIKLPFTTKSAPLIQSLCSSSATHRIRFVTLPEPCISNDTKKIFILKQIVESQKRHVAEAVADLGPALAGFVVDMFCIPMVDVANQLGVPTYLFYTSSASFLALLFHLQRLYDDRFGRDMDRLLNSAAEFAVPGFSNPVPAKIVSSVFCDRDANEWVLDLTRRFREARGILINTFSELEFDVMKWFSDEGLPPVYAVGPILNLGKMENRVTPEYASESEAGRILKWLNEQPAASVVFLCFGSKGSFNKSQSKEIAEALERCGVRFLWSLPAESVLPEGFVERTAGVGRVMGWAPQVEILNHPATGGFVSHCGWNSALESLWSGVAVAAWPMYAEQQLNGFQMVVEMGSAVEVSLDYKMGEEEENEGLILRAEKIEAAIGKLMDGSGGIKTAAAVKSEESRKAMMEGGSSFAALNRFIGVLVDNSK